jgi:hypothetical protein
MQIFALKMVAQVRKSGSLIEFFGKVKLNQKAPEQPAQVVPGPAFPGAENVSEITAQNVAGTLRNS